MISRIIGIVQILKDPKADFYSKAEASRQTGRVSAWSVSNKIGGNYGYI